jgi:UDP-N-acetylmuramyl pentapeptide phosphotransferase/UDP-N-acetylglucosamine-1-phosphate transferase
MAATGFGLWIAAWFVPLHVSLGDVFELKRVAALLALAGVLGLVGALDDMFDFGAKAKLAVQAALGIAFAVWVARVEDLPLGLGLSLKLGAVIGVLGVALWIVVAVNAVNFMDGANGLAPGAQVVLFAALAVAALAAGRPILAVTALIALTACLGFLPWNLKGRLFQGDAGALFCSFLFAGLSILLATGPVELSAQWVSLYFGPLALLPFLTDVLLTLAVRARRRQSLFQAHRDHLYQLWLRQTPPRPHLALTWRVILIMAGYAMAAWLLQTASVGLQPLIFVGAVMFSAAAWVLLRRRLEPRFKLRG